jgi:uncharacterized protein YkwD
LLLAAMAVTMPTACTTTPAPVPSSLGDTSWFPLTNTLKAAAALDEAAALLCARDTDAVIDDDVRAAVGMWEGVVQGIMAPTREQLVAQSKALLDEQGFTHIGVAEGASSSGASCVAAVASRRPIEVTSLPPTEKRDASVASIMTISVPRSLEARIFVMGPDGFVDRIPLESNDRQQSITLPMRREGRHVVEVLVDRLDSSGRPRGAPEVALLWPYVKGQQKLPMPVPEVLFPDEGHDDTALTYRAEALVQRLRNEQLLEPLKLSPPLSQLAGTRAVAVSTTGGLSHVVDGANPKAALQATFGDDPRASFIRLAEVQARGATLREAWEALVDSPAHRYELVSLGVTHAGVAVARGIDGLGRPSVTLVGLLGRRPPDRDVNAFQQGLLEQSNTIRTGRGLAPLRRSDTLENTARRLATRMMEVGHVDDTLLGGPVGEVALEADASMTKVYPLVARVDDPNLLGPFAPLLDLDTTSIGASFALQPQEGVFYVVILAGVGAGE